MKAKEDNLTRKIIYITIVCSFLGIGLAYVIANPITFYICSHLYTWDGRDVCLGSSEQYVAQGIFFFSIIILFYSILLLFLHKKIFNSWFSFSIFYVTVAMILILISNSYYNAGSWGLSFGNGTNFVSLFTASLFFVISFFLILWKWRQTRENDTAKA